MDGIDKITQRIQEDAQRELAQLEAQTQAQVDQILSQARAQADKERQDILRRGEQQAQERRERLISAAGMEGRKLALGAKQEMLSQAFDLALEKLCSMPDEEYVALLTQLALKAVSTGREQLIFSPKDRSRIGKQVVVAVNEALTSQVAPKLPTELTRSQAGALLGKVVNSATALITGTGLLTLSEETRPIRGGFILSDGDVEVNCSFETLVYLQREKLEKEVAGVLFQS